MGRTAASAMSLRSQTAVGYTMVGAYLLHSNTTAKCATSIPPVQPRACPLQTLVIAPKYGNYIACFATQSSHACRTCVAQAFVMTCLAKNTSRPSGAVCRFSVSFFHLNRKISPKTGLSKG